jgi:hypothetical protein
MRQRQMNLVVAAIRQSGQAALSAWTEIDGGGSAWRGCT